VAATDTSHDSVLAVTEGGPTVLRVEARRDLVIAEAVADLLVGRQDA
jgi:hypothetical protein